MDAPSPTVDPAFTPMLADIAEAAARVILPYWRSGIVAEHKADDSPVTRADREAETLILGELSSHWPDIQTVAEEASSLHGLPEEARRRFFLIDPLDGTRGFVRGGENFTVNIALIEDRRAVAGGIVAPALGLTWRCGLGGAFRRSVSDPEWTSIRVRPRPPEATALLSHSVREEEARAMGQTFGFTHWRGLDSSLKFCRLAEGSADLYPRTGPTSEWDTAAGQAILEAAGGSMTHPDGAPFLYGKPGFRNGGFLARGG